MRAQYLLSYYVLLAHAFAYTADIECPEHRCNDWMLSRTCNPNQVEEMKSTFAMNDTHVWIGVSERVREVWTMSEQFALMCALDRVNSMDNFLTDVSVDLFFADDKNSRGIEAALCFMYASVPLIVGPGSSDIAIRQSGIGKIFGNHYIGTHTSNPALSDHEEHPTFSRVYPSDTFQGSALAILAKRLGWRVVASLTETASSYATGVLNTFIDNSLQLGIEVRTSVTVSGTATDQEVIQALEAIKAQGIHVILTAFSTNDMMRRLLPLAKEAGMIGPDWAWLASESFVDHVAGLDDTTISDGVLLFVPALKETNNEELEYLQECFANHTGDTTGKYANVTTFIEENQGASGMQVDFWDSFVYDALFTAAHVLNTLGTQNVTDMDMVRSTLTQLSFQGVTGRVAFDSVGDRIGAEYDLVNFQSGVTKVVGSFVAGEDSVNITETIMFSAGNSNVPLEFHMNCVPQDYNTEVSSCHGTRTLSFTQKVGHAQYYCPNIPPVEVACDELHVENVMVPFVLNCLSVVSVFIVMVATLVHWENRIIRRGQRVWLLVLEIGALLGLCTPFLAFGPKSTLQCSIPSTMLSLSAVIMFGTLGIKSWKVQQVLIQASTKLRRVVISDKQIAVRLGILLIIDVIILAVFHSIDPIHPETTIRFADTHAYEFVGCVTKESTFMVVLLLYIGVIVLFGCVVSYRIRSIPSDFSETWYVFIAIYNSALCGMVAIAMTSVIQDPETNYTVWTIANNLACCGNVFLVMLPKFRCIRLGLSVTESRMHRTSYKGTNGTSRNTNQNTTSHLESLDKVVPT